MGITNALSFAFAISFLLTPTVALLPLAGRRSMNMTAIQLPPLQEFLPGFARCGEHLKKHPDEVICPDTCPFLRMEPTRFCQFKCVPREECDSDDPLSNFADPATMRCSTCNVAACHQCSATSADICGECRKGFVLHASGRCVSRNRHMWWALYAVIAVCIFLGMIYVVGLQMRPIVNEEVCHAGLSFRASSKIRDPETGKLYSLLSDLRNRCVAGIGVMMNFRFQVWALIWSIFVLFSLVCLRFFFSERAQAVRHEPSSERSYEACSQNVAGQKHEIVFMESVYFWMIVMIYFVTTVGCIVFSSLQRRFYRRQSDKLITMEDYALLATGFPAEPGTEDVEGSIQRFFQDELRNDIPDLKVVGVTVCWNYRNVMPQVLDLSKQEMEGQDLDTRNPDSEVRRTMHVERETEMATGRSAGRHACCDPQLKCIDSVFGIVPFPCLKSADPDLEGADNSRREEYLQKETQALMADIKNSGSAYVVFNTESQRDRALACFDQAPRKYKGEHEILLMPAECEPETVVWEGFGASDAEFNYQLVRGLLVILVAILVMDVFFYYPYVSYIMSYSEVSGMSQGLMVQGFLLGMLITVCNQIIYAVIAFITERMPFTSRGREQRFYVVLYTFAILFNTLIDLGTVMILAKGYSADEALRAHVQQDADSTISMKAVAENPSIQRSVYVQLVAYLFPGCLLAPFLLEPLAISAVPYWLGVRLVRSRAEGSIQDAEECLKCAPFDLSRYGDILINVMLCIGTLIFTYREVYLIFFYLFVSLVIIYLWDHVRVLKYSQHTWFSSPMMAYTSHYLLACPCGMLAAVVQFRIWAAKDDGFLDNVDIVRQFNDVNPMNRETIVGCMVAAFVAHVIVHSLILWWIVPKWDDVSEEHSVDVEYGETASRCASTWFNASPVHVLRSLHFFGHRPCCVQFKPGKAYLLKRNVDIGLYYEKGKDEWRALLHRESSSMEDVKGIKNKFKHMVTDGV